MLHRVLFLCLLLLLPVARAEQWFVEAKTGSRQAVAADGEGIFAVEVELPESLLVYSEPDRRSFRPQESAFRRYYAVELQYASVEKQPLAVKLFFKTKEGYFFQSAAEFQLTPNVWQALRIDLTAPARTLEPVGHGWQWCDLTAATVFNAGVKCYSDTPRRGRLLWKAPRFEGERPETTLTVEQWTLPSKIEKNRRFDSRFRLSREYFNAFDPEEIQVDFEVRRSFEETGRRFPAFYTLDYRNELSFTRETWYPTGAPYWSLRYLPQTTGAHFIRLHVRDRKSSITTPWRNFTVMDSKLPGPVGIHPENPRYLRFADGTPFWPIGINMHTNIDLRSEQTFQFGHRPDRGIADYQDYFEAAGSNGVNSVEIWLASWSLAIEWNMLNFGMYGVGRYNLVNAAKLDLLLELARKNGIYVHLTLDNHGKISSRTDPEWALNPMNLKSDYVAANGGFLEHATQFYSNEEAWKCYSRRNRYLAARYGADPTIWGVELWSEVDLTDDFRAHYNDKSALRWHERAAREWKSLASARHLMTTHVCGTYHRNIHYQELWKLPELDYVVGDGYRDAKHQIVDFLQGGSQAIKKTFPGKPYIVTEYGGTPGAGAFGNIRADIHGGIWSAFFLEYAGTPLLWWHDFIHVHQLYGHYRGLAEFIRDIDRADPALNPVPVTVSAKEAQALALAAPEQFYAWIVECGAMRNYPDKPDQAAKRSGLRLAAPDLKVLKAGRYRVDFYNTVTGESMGSAEIDYAGGALELDLPEMQIDMALKMRPAAPKGGAK